MDSYLKNRIKLANKLFQVAIDKELELDMDFNSTIDTTVEIKELITVKGNKVTLKYIDFGKKQKLSFNIKKDFDREDLLMYLTWFIKAIKKTQEQVFTDEDALNYIFKELNI